MTPKRWRAANEWLALKDLNESRGENFANLKSPALSRTYARHLAIGLKGLKEIERGK
jgi:hypothetical protein